MNSRLCPLSSSTERKRVNPKIGEGNPSPRRHIAPQIHSCSSLIRFSKMPLRLYPDPGNPLSALRLPTSAARRPHPNRGSATQGLRTLHVRLESTRPTRNRALRSARRSALCPSAFRHTDGASAVFQQRLDSLPRHKSVRLASQPVPPKFPSVHLSTSASFPLRPPRQGATFEPGTPLSESPKGFPECLTPSDPVSRTLCGFGCGALRLL